MSTFYVVARSTFCQCTHSPMRPRYFRTWDNVITFLLTAVEQSKRFGSVEVTGNALTADPPVFSKVNTGRVWLHVDALDADRQSAVWAYEVTAEQFSEPK
jgi:hypothetical protein